jgi:hypothetical protein
MALHTRDVPALRIQPKRVDARYYNRVRLALLRLGSPLRFELPEVGEADIVLTAEEWYCVDRARDDLPLMAWSDFQVRGRDALHEPVRCRLDLYHTHAGMLAGRALQVLDRVLARELGP